MHQRLACTLLFGLPEALFELQAPHTAAKHVICSAAPVWGGKGLFAGLYLHGDGFRKSVESHRHAIGSPLHPYKLQQNANPPRAHPQCARDGLTFRGGLYGCRGDPLAWRWPSTDCLKPSPCKYNPANSPLPPHTGAALQITCTAAVWGAWRELHSSK